MKNIRCSVCNDNNISQHKLSLTTSNGYLLKTCSNCKNVYTWIEDEVDISVYYDAEDYTIRDTRDSVFYFIQKLEYGKVIRKMRRLAASSIKSLLDFGCGKGIFLHFAKEMGISQVNGVETSLPRARYASEKLNLDVSTEEFDKGSIFNHCFDALTVFHVLEHVQLPQELLTNLLKDNLSPDGLLVAEVPAIDSWQSAWAGHRWLQLDTPRHLNHFTRAGFKKLIETSGYHIIRSETFSLHLGIIGMTQTIMSWFGYKGFLLSELKQEEKKIPLLVKVALALPAAILLEYIAALFNKGGVIRYYAVRKGNSL